MINIIEIVFPCYPVTDMARARKFYEGVLGLKPTYHTGEPGGIRARTDALSASKSRTWRRASRA